MLAQLAGRDSCSRSPDCTRSPPTLRASPGPDAMRNLRRRTRRSAPPACGLDHGLKESVFTAERWREDRSDRMRCRRSCANASDQRFARRDASPPTTREFARPAPRASRIGDGTGQSARSRDRPSARHSRLRPDLCQLCSIWRQRLRARSASPGSSSSAPASAIGPYGPVRRTRPACARCPRQSSAASARYSCGAGPNICCWMTSAKP